MQYMVASLREQLQEYHYTAETKVILIKQIIVSSSSFCCWLKQIFKKTLPLRMSNFPRPRKGEGVGDNKLGESFDWKQGYE